MRDNASAVGVHHNSIPRIEHPDTRHSRIPAELIVRGSTTQVPRVRQRQREEV